MSEREFEIYLTLLTRLLKLSPRQRQAIEQELRAHLEERLEDLLARGHSRDEAIAAALEEFGDAAGLADEFTRVARTARLRRRIMQTSIGTIAAAAAIILAVTFLLPEQRPGVPEQPRAQAQEKVNDETTVEVESLDLPDWLAEQTVTVEFNNLTLVEALHELAEQIEGDIFINTVVLYDVLGKDAGGRVSMRASELSAATALALLAESDDRLRFRDVDGVLMVTAAPRPEPALTMRIYTIRELVEIEGAQDAAEVQDANQTGQPRSEAQPESRRRSAAVSPRGRRPAPPEDLKHRRAQEVARVLQPILGDGNLHIYRGDLLVVRATEPVHEEIDQTLRVLRHNVRVMQQRERGG